jgi:hypothetical protein
MSDGNDCIGLTSGFNDSDVDEDLVGEPSCSVGVHVKRLLVTSNRLSTVAAGNNLGSSHLLEVDTLPSVKILLAE